MAEKYVQFVQKMYEESETVIRCAVGTAESFKVKIGLHQGLALSQFLFAVIMDGLTDKVRREPSWTMLFADDIVVEWLESRAYDQHGLGSKITRAILLSVSLGKALYGTFPCLVVLASSSKLQSYLY